MLSMVIAVRMSATGLIGLISKIRVLWRAANYVVCFDTKVLRSYSYES